MRGFKNFKGSDARCPSIHFLFYDDDDDDDDNDLDKYDESELVEMLEYFRLEGDPEDDLIED